MVQTEGYLLSCRRHSERNPVEANLVSEPWQYAWSSARAHALGETDALLADPPWDAKLARRLPSVRSSGGRFCWPTTPVSRSCIRETGQWETKRSANGCR